MDAVSAIDFSLFKGPVLGAKNLIRDFFPFSDF
jgi:hypothetical protein